MSQGDFLDWLTEGYGDLLRAAVQQAPADHEAITGALSVADPS